MDDYNKLALKAVDLQKRIDDEYFNDESET